MLRYLRLLAASMGLSDWELSLNEPDATPKGAWAGIVVSPYKSCASIAIDPGLFREPHAEQREVLVHELVHIHLTPIELSFAGLLPALDATTRKVTRAAYSERFERACDDLAKVLAPKLPLPPWK